MGVMSSPRSYLRSTWKTPRNGPYSNSDLCYQCSDHTQSTPHHPWSAHTWGVCAGSEICKSAALHKWAPYPWNQSYLSSSANFVGSQSTLEIGRKMFPLVPDRSARRYAALQQQQVCVDPILFCFHETTRSLCSRGRWRNCFGTLTRMGQDNLTSQSFTNVCASVLGYWCTTCPNPNWRTSLRWLTTTTAAPCRSPS